MKTDILDLEKTYWSGMQNHDYETVRKLTYFPCLVASKNGVRKVDVMEFKNQFDAGKDYSIKLVGIEEQQQQQINDDTIAMVYLITLETGMEGKTQTSTCACSSTWVQVDGAWKCAVHTESDFQKPKNP